MDQSSEAILLGASVLVVVELIPILTSTFVDTVALSLACAKLRLQELSLSGKSNLRIQWENDDMGGNDGSDRPATNNNQLGKGYLFSGGLLEPQSNEDSTTDQNPEKLLSNCRTIKFPSEDPLSSCGIPCLVIGYCLDHNTSRKRVSAFNPVVITNGTLLRILPGVSLEHTNDASSNILDELCGESEASALTEESGEEVIYSHNTETIRQLHLLMASQLSQPVVIGTTEDAMRFKARLQTQRNCFAKAVQRRCLRSSSRIIPGKHEQHNNPSAKSSLPSIMRDGALLLHCPNDGTGKTTLVKYIAKKFLNCSSIHVLQSGSLLAKYGSNADSGLESTLHAITVSAAVKKQSSICIILDHFDTFMPPSISGRSSQGDAAAPVFKAIASYLKTLVLSLKYRQEFPFPSKNMLYSLGGNSGHALSVKVCLVAIVTCPDNGWRSLQSIGHSACIFDALPIGTYRLPGLTAVTRFRAFVWAFEKEGVALTQTAQDRLHSLASSATWSTGSLNRSVAQKVRQRLAKRHRLKANVNDLESVFGSVGRSASGFAMLSIQEADDAAGPKNSPGSKEDPFSFIGGSSAAKESLRDALTLDDSKRGMLQSMGIDPPIGILFYGPPGCGKTLMAKGVARLLGAAGGTNAQRGGAFISLNSSEIAQAEIGSSEKTIVSAFQSARENAPSVLFIDEFQALFVERSKSGSGKLSSTLLQCMDDVKQWRKASKASNSDSPTTLVEADVVVLGATNTPWMIDKAFLRPGRFDRIVHVGLPSQQERESILAVHMSKMRLLGGPDTMPLLRASLAEKTNGFSGAELSALCRAATVRCLLEQAERVSETHFFKELKDTKSNSNAELVTKNRNWKL